MFREKLTFSVASFIVLLMATCCLPSAAQLPAAPQLVGLSRTQTADGAKSNGEINDFVVYGNATQDETGISDHDLSRPVVYVDQTGIPNFEKFFRFGGTLELLVTKTANTPLNLVKGDIVISELMWGLDTNNDNNTIRQWVELYNTTGQPVNIANNNDVALLFTPFDNMERNALTHDSVDYTVLDTVSNLHLVRWDLPGQNGRIVDTSTGTVNSPINYVVSAYRKIDYDKVKTASDRTEQLKGIPNGSFDQSWAATPARGARNLTDGLVGSPGAEHIASYVHDGVVKTVVPADTIVISEVRNDSSGANLDWIELINVRSTRMAPVQIGDWELSFVTEREDNPAGSVNAEERPENQIDLPRYELASGEILLIVNRDPYETLLAAGINIETPALSRLKNGLQHKYIIRRDMSLPDSGLILLRDKNDKNATDEAIQDYATGGGYYRDDALAFNTRMWPLKGWTKPDGVNVLAASRHSAFARKLTYTSLNGPYTSKRGFDKEGWTEVGTQGGVGYDPGIDLMTAPGTPGYKNDALKVTLADHDPALPNPSEKEYTTGNISISEIMYDAGTQRNQGQWIELYNNSMTEAVNLEGWRLDIRNHKNGAITYPSLSFIFQEAIILPNQTLLLVSDVAVNNVPRGRVYNLYANHRQELKMRNRKNVLLNPTGFHLKLTDVGDKTDSDRDVDVVVDEAGNLDFDGVSWKVFWDLPARNSEVRRSLLRRYGNDFTPNRPGFLHNGPQSPRNGKLASSWLQARANSRGTGVSFYGARDDISTPGYRLGTPLPVQLSSFRPERTDTGTVVIQWVTESELNNAGFNILRSETQNGTFRVVNSTLIQGAGTSSEKHIYRFTDTTAEPNAIYYYQIEDVSFEGTRSTLVTTRLKGDISAVDKLTTTWSNLKAKH